jgi:glutamate-1-semialdehyde aminotransferase
MFQPIPHTFNRAGSMIGFFFTNEPVINYEAAKSSDLKKYACVSHPFIIFSKQL